MRVRLFIVVLTITLMATTENVQLISAQETEKIIEEIKTDVNGDGNAQSLFLMGETLDDDTAYYQDVWLKIPSLVDKPLIHYGGGYKPSLKIVKNERDIPLLVFKSEQEERNTYTAHFYNEAKKNFKHISMPKLHYAQVKVANNYMIKLRTAPTVHPVTPDISSAPENIKRHLFDQSGNKKDSASLWMNQDVDYEVESLGNKDILNSLTAVHALNEDGPLIGHIQTKWRLSDGEWRNIQTTFKLTAF